MNYVQVSLRQRHSDVKDHDHENIEPNKEHNKLAERRVRLGLLLAELGQKAEVEVSEAEMTQAIMAQSRQYPGQEKEFFEFMQKNEQMQQQLRAPIFEDKVVDHIFEQATVTDKKVNKTEFWTVCHLVVKLDIKLNFYFFSLLLYHTARGICKLTFRF